MKERTVVSMTIMLGDLPVREDADRERSIAMYKQMVEERLLTESIYVSWVTNLASGPRAYSDKTRIISNEPRTPDDSYNTLYIADAVRDFVWDWCDFWVTGDSE